MSQLNFNAAQVKPQKAFEPVPNNWYNVVIDESEIKPTNAGDGAYLALRMNIMDGDYANQKLFCRLNIQNNNAKTVEIAYEQLSAICHATNTIQVGDSTELHGKPFMVKVVVKPPKDGYDASNEFKGFKACDGATGGNTAGGGDGAPGWANNNQQQQQQGNQQQDNQQQNQQQETTQQTNQQSWQQNNNQQNSNVKQTNNTDAVVEQTPEQSNGGGNQTAPWMQKK